MKKLLFVLTVLGITGDIYGAPQVRLVPVFAERIGGANGSTWQSELRFYNDGSTVQRVELTKIMPLAASACPGFPSFDLLPGSVQQRRTIGCGIGAAAVEVTADSSVLITSVITNVGGTPQDACCLSGYTQNIPVIPVDEAYTSRRVVPSLQVPRVDVGTGVLGRHNIGFVNPNSHALEVEVRYYNAVGEDLTSPTLSFLRSISIPPGTLVQVSDVFRPERCEVVCGQPGGYWRIVGTGVLPFFLYDSFVDNCTNDATFNQSYPTTP